MPEESNPTSEEPSLLEQFQREIGSLREEIAAIKSSPKPAEESDSEVADLANLFDGLGKKLDEVLGFVKPKETVVGNPPGAPAAPAAPTPKPRKAGFFW